jgi:aspartyl-tRNA(Asn)/glutamyl-tRNA(Gln) amidotransferase subunit C
MATTFTPQDVDRIAKLALIPVSDEEKKELAGGFNTVIEVLDTLKKVDVSHTEPTHQVTGLENVYREDEVDESRMFTQEEALANAPKKHDGYFMVDQVIDQDSA